MGELGNAPAVTAFVDGAMFLHVAVPVLRLSTIGQIAVVIMWKEPRLLFERNCDGGLIPLFFVEVHPGPLNQTSSALASICALSMTFMLVADAPFRMLETYVFRVEQTVDAPPNGPAPEPSPV